MKINEINVSQETKNALLDMNFVELTPIQAQTIPILLEGKDVIGQSHTGTGKTAAFAVPILEKIDPSNKKTQALILCPTRELAVQVSNEIKRIAKYTKHVRVVAVYGGEPIHRQINSLKKGAQIIVGTPGRTIDHIERRHTIKTEFINTLVLDEADEMLNMGFREEIEQVLVRLPEERQTVLFSATMPKPILALTKKYQKNPVFLKVESANMTADTIEQEYCETSSKHKFEALLRLIAINNPKRCIAFCNMKSTVDNIGERLITEGIFSEKIHGDLKQEQRMNVLKMFNAGKVNILVATDVAARGLDIQDVDLIINYDMPEKSEYYVHRIGRSGRAGKKGRSITLVTKREKRQLQEIMRYTNKEVARILIPTKQEVQKSKIEHLLTELSANLSERSLETYLPMIHELEKEIPLEQICVALMQKTLSAEKDYQHEDINLSFDTNPRKATKPGSKRPLNKNATRLFFSVGKRDNIGAKDIVHIIIKEAHLTPKAIGSISVMNNFSFVDVDRSCAQKVVKNLFNKKLKGKKIHVEEAKS
jgi:ATP-dependent RNA helicase DeaD